MNPEKYGPKLKETQCQRQNDGHHRGELSIDHHTPQCLFDVETTDGEKWLDFNKNSSDNLQILCHRHHRLKDRTTNRRKWILERTLAGEKFPLDKHMAAFKQKITQSQIDWLIKFLEEN